MRNSTPDPDHRTSRQGVARGPLLERRFCWRPDCRYRDWPGRRTIALYRSEVIAECHARRYNRSLFIGREPTRMAEWLSSPLP